MPALTTRQSAVIATLFAAAPDAAVRRLEQALAEEIDQGGPLAEVHALIAKESAERRVRAAVLGPVIPLCRPSDLGDARFPAATIPRLWRALRATCPDLVAAAETACLGFEEDERRPFEIYDQLCAEAADGLRGEDPPIGAARELLGQGGQGAPGAVHRLSRSGPAGPARRRPIARMAGPDER